MVHLDLLVKMVVGSSSVGCNIQNQGNFLLAIFKFKKIIPANTTHFSMLRKNPNNTFSYYKIIFKSINTYKNQLTNPTQKVSY